MQKVKNILIMGGTGAMGSHLVTLLSGLGGVNVTVTSRSKHASAGETIFRQGDAKDLSFLGVVLNEHYWDAIVDFMQYTTDEFYQRYERLLSSTKQYVFLSSSRVYAESECTLTENSPRILDVCTNKDYLSTDEYALKKARQEDILKTCGKNNWTIIRPYITFSEYRLQLSPLEKEHWLYRALKGRTIVFSKDLADRKTTFTYGNDVAKGIASILGKDSAQGQVFHITCNETVTWREILDKYVNVIEEETGIKTRVLFLDKWKPYMGGNEYQVKWDRYYDRIFDTSKISQYINTQEFSPTLTSVSSCLRAFIRQPVFKSIDWVKEADKDRATGEWANINEIPGVRQKLKYYLVRIGLYSR